MGGALLRIAFDLTAELFHDARKAFCWIGGPVFRRDHKVVSVLIHDDEVWSLVVLKPFYRFWLSRPLNCGGLIFTPRSMNTALSTIRQRVWRRYEVEVVPMRNSRVEQAEEARRAANKRFYNQEDDARWGRRNASRSLPQDLIRDGDAVLEVGCGNGPTVPTDCESLVVADISYLALRGLDVDRPLQCDAHRLPIRSESVDVYVSVAAFEHFPDPSLALKEMDRVLRREGVAFLAPAWNCRSWTASGITMRSYGELNVLRMLHKSSLLIRERIWWRATPALLRRTGRELRLRVQPSARLNLHYRRLKPNLDEYLVSDSDAWASIDPHAAIVALKTWGYEIVSHPSLQKRMMARHEPVVVRKH